MYTYPERLCRLNSHFHRNGWLNCDRSGEKHSIFQSFTWGGRWRSSSHQDLSRRQRHDNPTTISAAIHGNISPSSFYLYIWWVCGRWIWDTSLRVCGHRSPRFIQPILFSHNILYPILNNEINAQFAGNHIRVHLYSVTRWHWPANQSRKSLDPLEFSKCFHYWLHLL